MEREEIRASFVRLHVRVLRFSRRLFSELSEAVSRVSRSSLLT